MSFYLSAYSVLLLFGYINGWLFALLFAFRAWRRQSLSQGLLAVLMALLTQTLMLYMLGFGGIEIFWQEWLFVPTQVGLLIGPAFWLYIQSLVNADFRLRRSHLWHLAPFGAYVSFHVVVLLLGPDFLAHWHPEVYIGMRLYLVQDGLEYVSICFYLVKANRFYREYRTWVVAEYADAGLVLFDWLWVILCAISSGLAVGLVVFLADSVFQLSFEQDWWDHVYTIVLIYYLGFAAWAQPPHKALRFNNDLKKPKSQEVGLSRDDGVPSSVDTQELNSKEVFLESPQMDDQNQVVQGENSTIEREWQQFLAVFELQKSYLNPELTLTTLADASNVKARILSQMIKQMSGLNFNEFVNQYRVQEVQRLMLMPSYKHYNLVGLSFEAGFNSKATFNRSFKEVTGISPKEYAREVQVG